MHALFSWIAGASHDFGKMAYEALTGGMAICLLLSAIAVS